MEPWVSFCRVRVALMLTFSALCAGALSFWLPETNNQPMTTTIDEFETKYARGSNQVEDVSGLDNDGYDEDHL